MTAANVFVELYTDRIEISSPGGLPKGMKLSDLGHKSVRRNALIADLLHRIEFIEKAGTGIKRIRDDAHDHGCPEPVFEETGFVTATFFPNPEVRAPAGAMQGPSTAQVPHKSASCTAQVRIVPDSGRATKTRDELQSALGLTHRQHFIKEYLNPLLKAGLIEMTIPDKPRSPKQRYRTTPAGINALAAEKEEK